ncbi:ADP-forming succinate--CoA ligase subunit beta [Arsenophonus symbiont of Ornithomya chloropus]|uniref:ADP-forming succinate--CoA ligase subunit beta n=1 Tax=Arsenophonus symbiont of Ornithomya chloropus TaxID=634121 RepID=UPI0032B1E7DD
MNLHEYQVKKLFLRYGLSVPISYLCETVEEAEKITRKLGNNIPLILKCQVHAGGRGKAGGIKIVYNREELIKFVKYWLGKRLVTYQTDINGQPVNQILIEEVTNIDKEIYLGAVIDRSIGRIVFMASMEGGVEIEKIAKKKPELIYKSIIDPLIGPMFYQGRELAFKLGLNSQQVQQFVNIFIQLATIFIKYDLTLIEINPLVINKNGDLICLDGKLIVDSNAIYRQKELNNMRDIFQEEEREVYASKWGLNYVALNGNIGCMVNGAGLAMGTMDIIKLYGGVPANFLDVGGSATTERVKEAFKIILSDNNVKAILVNIFGGIVRCDLIADGIILAIKEIGVKIPVIVRLEGNNSDLAIQKLSISGLKIIIATSLIDAVKKVVAVAEVNK